MAGAWFLCIIPIFWFFMVCHFMDKLIYIYSLQCHHDDTIGVVFYSSERSEIMNAL